jgi:excisionase family DNA binding protein
MEDRLLTVREAAERLRVSEWTIRRWLRTGELKGSRFGDKAGWRVRESELEAFLKRKEGGR